MSGSTCVERSRSTARIAEDAKKLSRLRVRVLSRSRAHQKSRPGPAPTAARRHTSHPLADSTTDHHFSRERRAIHRGVCLWPGSTPVARRRIFADRVDSSGARGARERFGRYATLHQRGPTGFWLAGELDISFATLASHLPASLRFA